MSIFSQIQDFKLEHCSSSQAHQGVTDTDNEQPDQELQSKTL